MSKFREKEKIERAKRIFEAKENFKNENDEFYNNFIEMLYSNGFFNNLQENEIEKFKTMKNENSVYYLFKTNGITVGVYDYVDGKLVGIDPSNCFDKTSKCSIHAIFPMKKRKYARFEKFMKELLNEKSGMRKLWELEASTSWYGGYAKFGI